MTTNNSGKLELREVSTDELRTVEGGWIVVARLAELVLIRLGWEGRTPSDKENYVSSLPPEG